MATAHPAPTMARLLPPSLQRSAPHDATPRVIGIEGDDADDLLAALSSSTARSLLAALHDDPSAASELADRVGTSLQNVQYHLGRLEGAGVIEVIDTVYSEKGREMKLYAPADKPLVVVAAGDSETASLRKTLTRLFGGVAVLGLAAAVVQAFAGRNQVTIAAAPARDGGAGGGVGIMEAATPTPVAAPGGTPFDALLGFLTEPGVLFFAGGLAVLLVVLALARVRR